MPKIMSDRIVWDRDDFLGGFAPDIPTAVTNIRHLGNGYSFARAFNPMQTVPGVAYPGKASTNLTNVSGSFPDHVLTSIDTPKPLSHAIALGGEKVYRVSTTTLINTGDYPHTITA